MTREDIINKIRKVQALAQGGVGGEKESAEARLQELMTKYHITLEDLNGDQAKEHVFWYRCKGEDYKVVFTQVAACHCGVSRLAWCGADDHSLQASKVKRASTGFRPRGSNVAIICSYMKFIEVTTAYEIYQKAYDKAKEAFIYAFLFRNDLLGKGNGIERDLTAEEKEMLLNAGMMMAGIEKTTAHKQLGSGYSLPEHCE